MNEHCIVNVATGGFVRGQKRLVESLRKMGYAGEMMLWSDSYSDGSPTHNDVPYGFKCYAFVNAQSAGYKTILWLDSSMVAIRNPEPVFQHIEHNGHLFESGWRLLGHWCTDAFLQHHGLSRNVAMSIPMFSAGFMGLDLRQPKSEQYLYSWLEMSKDGVSFIGPHSGTCDDPRYKGHRHDMSAASLLAEQMEMEISSLAMPGHEPEFDKAVVKYRHHPHFATPPFMQYATDVLIGDNTCFLCQGI